MKCIFCEEEQQPKEEHVFPKALGGTLCIYRVCDKCNSDLGTKADAPLIDHPTIVMRRAQLGLTGQSGKVPDPAKALLDGSHLTGNPDVQFRIKTGRDGTLEISVQQRGVEVPAADGSIEEHLVFDIKDRNKIAEVIRKKRARSGLPPLPDEEIEKIIEAGARSVEQPTFANRIKIDLVEFKRGLYKIAYELAFHWFGEAYLSDTRAKVLRGFALGKEPVDDALAGACFSSNCKNDPPWQLWANELNSHLAMGVRSDEKLLVMLRVFDVVSASIVVSEQASRYVGAPKSDPNMDGRFLRIDPVGGQKWEMTMLDEISRLSGIARDTA